MYQLRVALVALLAVTGFRGAAGTCGFWGMLTGDTGAGGEVAAPEAAADEAGRQGFFSPFTATVIGTLAGSKAAGAAPGSSQNTEESVAQLGNAAEPGAAPEGETDDGLINGMLELFFGTAGVMARIMPAPLVVVVDAEEPSGLVRTASLRGAIGADIHVVEEAYADDEDAEDVLESVMEALLTTGLEEDVQVIEFTDFFSDEEDENLGDYGVADGGGIMEEIAKQVDELEDLDNVWNDPMDSPLLAPEESLL